MRPKTSATDTSRVNAPRTIAALAYPGVQLLDLLGPLEAFSLASRQLIEDGDRTESAYRMEVFSDERGPVQGLSGLSVVATRHLDETLPGVHTLLVPGGLTGDSFYRNPAYVAWIQRYAPRVERVCSVCSGALLLAGAGLLDGRRATTHWMDADELECEFPKVRVERDRIYTEDGGIYTSGGITAGIDLALALIEADHDRRLALKVAKRLLVFLKRPGDQSQFSSVLDAQYRSSRFAGLLDWLSDHLHEPVTVAELAARVHMSERSFRRHFEAEVGTGVRSYLARARLARARDLLENSRLTLEDIARRSGFASADSLRYTFVNELDVTPSDYRKRFGSG